MRVYLVRHGQTTWNVEQRAQGHADLPLDDTGLAQAEHVGEAFKKIKIQRILSSDLLRAMQTADPISKALGVPIEVRTALRERDFGDWEGRDYTEIARDFSYMAKSHPTKDRNYVRPPGGESMSDVWDRLTPILKELENDERDTAIVSHGGTCALLLARMIGGDRGVSSAFKFYNASINELVSNHGRFRLVRYNDISHLTSVEAIAGSIDGSTR